MGNPFRIVYDDLSSGYYVGETDARQPKSAWTGENVNVALHDGSVVPTNKVKQLALSNGAVIANGGVADNSIWLESSVANSTIAIVDIQVSVYSILILQYENIPSTSSSRFRLISVSLPDAPWFIPPSRSGVVASSWVTGSLSRGISNMVIEGNFAYVAYGNTLYRFNIFSFGFTTTVIPGTTSGHRLYVWNNRMIAVRQGEGTFYFSDAGDFMTWPTLNFITVANSNTQIRSIVARYDDLLILKDDGVYSLTGVLSINASIRQIYDGIYAAPGLTMLGSGTGPGTFGSVSKFNRLFYINQNTAPFHANIQYLYGQQQGVAAFYNFGQSLGFYGNGPKLASSFDDYLLCAFPLNYSGQDGFGALIRKPDNRWVKITQEKMTFYDAAPAEKNQYVFKYVPLVNSTKPSYAFYDGLENQPFFFAQVGNKIITSGSNLYVNSRIVISLSAFYLEQTNAGVDYDGWASNTDSNSFANYSSPTTGTLKLSKVETEKPSKITDVYVEAAIDLDFANYGEMAGTATMQVKAVNEAVDDITYSTTSIESSTKQQTVDLESFGSPDDYPGLNEFPVKFIGPRTGGTYQFTDIPDKRLGTARVLRFRVDDGGYGYLHQVAIQFSGFRIKRVWVEGEFR